MPYGGIDKSGAGREGPKFSVEEMTEIRMVVFNKQDVYQLLLLWFLT